MKEFGIEKGLERILDLAKTKEQKPVLIAVCGYADSGKTFLCTRAREKFTDEKISMSSSYDGKSNYRCASHYDYFFIHVPLDKIEISEVSKHTQKHLGKPVDISVHIYNPDDLRFEKPDLEHLKKYDVVIKNTGALYKDIDAAIGVIAAQLASSAVQARVEKYLSKRMRI
ncbi:MAG: hypothetical protein Q7J54_03535 [Candidatus Woesearchaeota archaeon]|nr:hypothetical protein [Candidatus Woesearchaeota archaeon]